MTVIAPDRAATALPLAEFLTSLSDLGIRASLDDHRRIALALRAGGPWTVAQLRGVLASLLARNRDQAREVRRRFDQFFDLSLEDPLTGVDVERALAELRGLAGEAKIQPPIRRPVSPRSQPARRQAPSRSWKWSVLAALVVALLPLLQEDLPSGPRQQAERSSKIDSSTSKLGPTGTETGTASLALAVKSRRIESRGTRTYPSAPVLRLRAFHPAPVPPAWADFRILTLAALGYAFWAWRWVRSKRRARVGSTPRDGSRRLFRPALVGGSLAPRLDRPTLDRVADSLGYFRGEEVGQDLDARASVERTIDNGGIPTPVFELRRQVKRVLILEDLHAEARSWNPIARELASGLSQRGVPVLHGLFAGVPDRFRDPDGLMQRIEDLEDERRGYLVLVFSDAKGLGSAAAGFVLERLAHWPQVAWMQLQERRAWDRTAARPALHGLSVFPADRDGLLQAVSAFASERAARETTPSPEGWQGLPPFFGPGNVEFQLEQVLGDSLLWAQACAMAPPPLGLGLADRLRERFHPDLPPERIERLLALPGSRLIAGGLGLDPRVLAVLRQGFARWRSPAEQQVVLEFLLEQIRRAEPPDPESLEHQAWEWRLERTRLELDPERAIERLAALARGPLKEAIRMDLASDLPLRARPGSRHAAEQLAALADGREISPFRPWPIAAFAVAGSILVALFLWRASFLASDPPKLDLARSTPGIEGPVTVKIERQRGGGWEPATQFPLGDGETHSFQVLVPGELRISAFLAGKGRTGTRLKTLRPGTYAMDLVAESRRLPCREELPAIHLAVIRCPSDLQLGQVSDRSYLRSRLAEPARRNWLARIGVEFSFAVPASDAGEILLAAGDIDILYRVAIPEFAGRGSQAAADQIARAMDQIRQRWQPWSGEVRLISWAVLGAGPRAIRFASLEQGEVSLADWPPDFKGSSFLFFPPLPGIVSAPKTAERQQGPAARAPMETPAPDQPVQRVLEGVADMAGGTTWDADSQSIVEGPTPSCSNPALTRCGEQCVDLKTNPFHDGACFSIAPSLTQASAERVDSPPPWTDEKIWPRRYYRLFYAWNDSRDAVVVRSLPARSGWDEGEAPDSIELTLSAKEIAGAGSAMVATDLDVHCWGSKLVADVSTLERRGYSKRGFAWNSASFGWITLIDNSEVAKILGRAFDEWDKVCSGLRP